MVNRLNDTLAIELVYLSAGAYLVEAWLEHAKVFITHKTENYNRSKQHKLIGWEDACTHW